MGSGEPRGSRFSDGSFQALLAVGGIGLVLIAGIVGWGIGRSTTPSETVTVGAGAQGEAVEEETIAAAPAFSANAMTPKPSKNWITKRGTLMNQRYSTLKQIETKN